MSEEVKKNRHTEGRHHRSRIEKAGSRDGSTLVKTASSSSLLHSFTDSLPVRHCLPNL
jgi:hypothetical protein